MRIVNVIRNQRINVSTQAGELQTDELNQKQDTTLRKYNTLLTMTRGSDVIIPMQNEIYRPDLVSRVRKTSELGHLNSDYTRLNYEKKYLPMTRWLNGKYNTFYKKTVV